MKNKNKYPKPDTEDTRTVQGKEREDEEVRRILLDALSDSDEETNSEDEESDFEDMEEMPEQAEEPGIESEEEGEVNEEIGEPLKKRRRTRDLTIRQRLASRLPRHLRIVPQPPLPPPSPTPQVNINNVTLYRMYILYNLTPPQIRELVGRDLSLFVYL